MKKIIITVLVLLSLAAVLVVLFWSKENGPKFRTDKVSRGAIISAVTATGTVNAVTTVLVGTQASGTIRQLYADFNSPVRKGQVIAQIDPATFEAQVDQAKANLMSAQANLEKTEATLTDAKRSLGRNRELFSSHLIARSDVDTAETNYDIAKAQVTAAKAQVSLADAALRTALTNLGYTRIVSPVDGIVVSRNVDIGQTVAASFQTPTLFTIARDLTKMQIDANVDEADIGRIKVGQQVDFTVDAYPDTAFKGTVSQIRNAPITVQNVVTYDVVIKVDNREARLKPGMTANVSIIISSKNNVLKVPNAALRFRVSEKIPGGEQKKGPGIWTLENGKTRRIAVSTGISDGNYTEVVSDSLKEGEQVIIESLSQQKKPNISGPRMF